VGSPRLFGPSLFRSLNWDVCTILQNLSVSGREALLRFFLAFGRMEELRNSAGYDGIRSHINTYLRTRVIKITSKRNRTFTLIECTLIMWKFTPRHDDEDEFGAGKFVSLNASSTFRKELKLKYGNIYDTVLLLSSHFVD